MSNEPDKRWQLAHRGQTHSVWFSRIFIEYLERLICDGELCNLPMQHFAAKELADFECATFKHARRRGGEVMIIENGLTPKTYDILLVIDHYAWNERYQSEIDTRRFKELGIC